ncbi:MAG TPA: cobyric acid synthase [Solirubrobacteraceae bacterium]|nr:cobyric acid synthase [Solirubrobacteraceae bacterium]
MVQGCTSSAGKSLIATVLCRHFSRLGVRVAPFKGQNMSNHARVGEGGEMGAAQYFQALAAGVPPDVRMNPVLVKPEGERESQVVVLGCVEQELSRTPWRERSSRLRPSVLDALDSLADEHELLVIEGAGSPAEINLADCDLANLAVARHSGAPVLLLADIDRGGAFAHLYGTWRLLAEPDRKRIAGWILNRFRGERELLAPAPQRLRELTGVRTLGVVPEISHGLPEEDGTARSARPASTALRVAVVRYPTASNLDELSLIEQVATLEWTAAPAAVESADLVVLPGSKHVSADLEWVRERGLAGALARRVAAGGRVLAICGGMQIAGRRLRDRGAGERDAAGLDLLALESTFAPSKRVGRVEARFARLPAPWQALSGLKARGYEIRHGSSRAVDDEQGGSADRSGGASADGGGRGSPGGRGGSPMKALPDGLGFVEEQVLGVYPHGLLEDPAIVRALLGETPRRSVEQAIDELTDAVIAHLDLDQINALAGVG